MTSELPVNVVEHTGDLCAALHKYLIDCAGLVDRELNRIGHKALMLRPAKSLDFPVGDIKSITEKENQVEVIINVLGLYGVDSPLPMYFNAMSLGNDDFAKDLRNFLDIFNHRSYVLRYFAWKRFDLESSANYHQLNKQLLGWSISCATSSFGKSNRALLDNFLAQFFSGAKFTISDRNMGWIRIENPSFLGNELSLGSSVVLGDRIICENKIIVSVGPVDNDFACNLFSDAEKKNLFSQFLQQNYGLHLNFQVYLQVVSVNKCIAARDNFMLGINTCIGEIVAENHLICRWY